MLFFISPPPPPPSLAHNTRAVKICILFTILLTAFTPNLSTTTLLRIYYIYGLLRLIWVVAYINCVMQINSKPFSSASIACMLVGENMLLPLQIQVVPVAGQKRTQILTKAIINYENLFKWKLEICELNKLGWGAGGWGVRVKRWVWFRLWENLHLRAIYEMENEFWANEEFIFLLSVMEICILD